MTIAVFATNLAAPRIAEAWGDRRVIACGLAVVTVGCLALLGSVRSPYVALVGQFIAIGAGLGLVVPPLTSALLGSVEKSRSGVASGALNAMRQTGSVLGVALFGSLLAASGGLVDGARIALAISTALLALACVATLLGLGRERRAA